jgi:hypothetical protein
MGVLSTTKAAAILAEVQLNPEIGTDDASFVTSVIDRAARWLINQVGLSRYPELEQGYSESGASPSTDISGLSSNQFLIGVDSENWQTIELTLAGLTSGAAIATEIESQIQAVGTGAYKFVTCTYENSLYTITSPTYGENSVVNLDAQSAYEHVLRALTLSPVYGGEENPGGDALPEYDDMVVRLVQHWYNQVGVEGMKSHNIQGSASYTEHDVDPIVARFITENRRLFR